MKFILALIASASAIKMTATESAPGVCVSMDQSNHVFDLVDTNDDGQVSKKELTIAVTSYLDQHDIHPTKAQIKAFTGAAKADAGADHTLSPAEFNKLANQVAHYIAPNHCA